MKRRETWYSERLQRDVSMARWGSVGVPFLIFPTAGGDCEEIERFHVVSALAPALEQGRIKIYSCDSVAGRAMLVEEGSCEHRMWLMNRFQEYVRYEVVPAIRTDCHSDDIPVLVGGASIGAFQALAAICRYPEVFSKALCMSGTYDLARFLKGRTNADYYHASPLDFVPALRGHHAELLRQRFVIFASGEGEAENIGQSWAAARVLGDRGVPNRVDSWGPEWKHDWPLWRTMVTAYLDELAPR